MRRLLSKEEARRFVQKYSLPCPCCGAAIKLGIKFADADTGSIMQKLRQYMDDGRLILQVPEIVEQRLQTVDPVLLEE